LRPAWLGAEKRLTAIRKIPVIKGRFVFDIALNTSVVHGILFLVMLYYNTVPIPDRLTWVFGPLFIIGVFVVRPDHFMGKTWSIFLLLHLTYDQMLQSTIESLTFKRLFDFPLRALQRRNLPLSLTGKLSVLHQEIPITFHCCLTKSV
jgi:hypothetical protein